MSKSLSLSSRIRIFLKLSLLLLAATFGPTACTESAQRPTAADRSTTPTPQTPPTAAATPAPTEPDARPTAAPPLADVQGALARVYHDAVILQASRGTPFIVGDFNGDNSQDIAVVVAPAKGKLPKLNSEYASWLVGDPRQVVLPEVRGDVKVFPKRPEPVVVRQDDLLLVVIHGYQQEGWRNPLSMQTFLLRHAVGDEMQTRPAEIASAATADKGRLPPLQGDVIWETQGGETGFIYWTGAKYAWSGPTGHQ